jgi:hypothetical protein
MFASLAGCAGAGAEKTAFANVRFTNAFTGHDTDLVWAQAGGVQFVNSFGGKDIDPPLPTAAVRAPVKKFTASAGLIYHHETSSVASTEMMTLPANAQLNAVGYGAVGERRIVLIPDEFTPSPSGTYSLRILNASTRAGAIDVYVGDVWGTFPDTPKFANVPVGEATIRLVEPLTTPDLPRVFRVYAAGDHTTLLAEGVEGLLDSGKYTLMVRNMGPEGESVTTGMLRDFDPRL